MVQRMKAHEVREEDVLSFKKEGAEMHVYYAGDRETIVEVSVTRKQGGGLAGFSYMSNECTPTALKKIAEVVEKAGVPRTNKY